MTSVSNLDKIEEALKVLTTTNNPYMISMDANGLRTHANEFIKDAGVMASQTEKVSSRLIYWRYLKWCVYKGIKPMSKNRLLDGWGKYFKRYKKTSKYTTENGYYIENKNFIITKEEMEVLCQYEKRERQIKERRQLKKQKKKMQKIEKKQEEIEKLIQVLSEDSSHA